jgi:phytoene desaturase
MVERRAIIIGAGIAGMASAARLAAKGWRVQVFEANSTFGGKLGALQLGAYHFDTGPSLFTQPQNLHDLFEACGKSLTGYLDYKKMDISCQYFFEDGTVVSAYTNHQKLANELEQKLSEPALNTLTYLQNSQLLYTNIGTIFLNFSLHKFKTWVHRRIIKAMRAVKLPYLFSSLHTWNSKQLKQSKTIQIFDRFATYNGSNPYSTPAMMSMIPHLELTEGTFYPTKGMRSIADALYQLCLDVGVRFTFDAPVQEILLTKEKTAHGIRVTGINHYCEVVVSNADAYLTYKQLLRDEKSALRNLRQERSCSGIIFYWGISKAVKSLQLHNIFFAEDYKQEFETIFQKKQISADPTVYVNITSVESPTHAPSDAQNWFVLINAPSTNNADWQQVVDETRHAVISKLDRMLGIDLVSLIEQEAVLDPKGIEQKTNSYLGALYGTASNDRFAAFLRQANFSRTYPGLYFCGGSVHPGGGIPLCLKSGHITAQLIDDKYIEYAR